MSVLEEFLIKNLTSDNNNICEMTKLSWRLMVLLSLTVLLVEGPSNTKATVPIIIAGIPLTAAQVDRCVERLDMKNMIDR